MDRHYYKKGIYFINAKFIAIMIHKVCINEYKYNVSIKSEED